MMNGSNTTIFGPNAESNPGSGSRNLTSDIDYNHPLFLHSFDVSGSQIISFQLTNSENYSMWYRLMKVALLGRNKMRLVDGSRIRIYLVKGECCSIVMAYEFCKEKSSWKYHVCNMC